MDYEQAVRRIASFEKFGSRLGLERMRRLMALLGDPQDRVRMIHVGGTNGKGSVCRFLYSVLREAGYKAGIYLSPYLERFTERIEFDGREISREDLARYAGLVLEKADQMTGAGEESPTEFEIVTAIGFCYFEAQKADVVLLEVGLGGAGDSTNIIREPEISVITSIAYDHMDYLGETLAKIAREKAGIIKAGVPVAVHVKDGEAMDVIREEAHRTGSRLYEVRQSVAVIRERTLEGSRFDALVLGKQYTDLDIGLLGDHQIDNALCALTALEVLRSENRLSVEDGAVYDGFRKARHPGRLEILRRDPYYIIDGAHNEAGALALAETIRARFGGKKILLVIGMLKDKRADRILEILLPIADAVVATEPDSPRKLDRHLLGQTIEKFGRDCILAASAEEAVNVAMHRQDRFDAILFAGSLYLVGKVRSIINETL